MAEVKFPTEVVDLPSKGLLYPEDSSISTGKVEVRYMTAKDEDILTSPNLIKQGIVIDKLLESLIVDKDIKVENLLSGDKNAILIIARILAYGKNYEFKLTKPPLLNKKRFNVVYSYCDKRDFKNDHFYDNYFGVKLFAILPLNLILEGN